MRLSDRIGRIKPSPTLAITAKAKNMVAKGIDVISFGAGEPDFDTPNNIKDKAIEAIREGFTRYTPPGGTDELKEAIRDKLLRDNGLSYDLSQIVVNCGAKHTLYNLAQAFFNRGDEAIIPAPYWVSYPDIVTLAEAKPVIVETSQDQGFIMTPEDFKKAITPRTKAVVINSPANPTGAFYSKEELVKIGEIARKKEILIISDDIYEKILYDGRKFVSIVSILPEMKGLTVVVNGVSKTYAMTGWRIGYAAGPQEIIGAITKIQSQSTSNPTSIAQKAAIEALRGPQDSVAMMTKEFEKRRKYMVDELNNIAGVSCFNPRGAFYLFPNFSAFYGRSFQGKTINNSLDLTDYLLDTARVAVVAGVAFGADNFIRISFAASMETIREGVKRIKEAVDKLE
jgi:aspartate aminotransferase